MIHKKSGQGHLKDTWGGYGGGPDSEEPLSVIEVTLKGDNMLTFLCAGQVPTKFLEGPMI